MQIRKHMLLPFIAGDRYAEYESGYFVALQAHLASHSQLLVASFTTAASECCARCVQHVQSL